jgi:hypothetical protein
LLAKGNDIVSLMRFQCAVVLLGMMAPLAGAADILMVADELPAMGVLSKQLKTRIGATAEIVTQDKMPADLQVYPVVMVYIHKDIDEAAEKAFIAYAKGGGKLILLHHSISSGKRKNQMWFPFLNISLPTGEFAAGGYKYFDPATFQVVNVAPGHFITSNQVTYEEKTEFEGAECPAFTLRDTEIYLNHVFDGPRTVLLGVKYVDAGSGREYMQRTGGWYRAAGKGSVMYFMAGHKAADFDVPVYAQILANAVKFPVK